MKWLLLVITALHGLIHTMGFFNETGIKKIDGFSGDTLIKLSGNTRHVLGVVWLLVAVMMVVVAIGIVAGAGWWKPLAIASIAISQLLIIMWWPDAKMGTVPNIVLLAAVLFWKH